MTEKLKPNKSKTSFSLENILLLQYSPTGVRDFMVELNEELNLGPIQSSFNRRLGTFADITKYVSYISLASQVVYEYMNSFP